MPHGQGPHTPAGPTDSARIVAAEGGLEPVELPSERSRFSRWLARFGLGELTETLLRPAEPHAPRRSGMH